MKLKSNDFLSCMDDCLNNVVADGDKRLSVEFEKLSKGWITCGSSQKMLRERCDPPCMM